MKMRILNLLYLLILSGVAAQTSLAETVKTIRVEESGTAGAPAGTVKSRTFNVLNYGAVGDDKTDNTEAFSACLKAVIAAGGGKMFIPDGIYRGRIIIPGSKEWITVEIVGESEPTPVWGTIGPFPFPKNGTIIQCLAESGCPHLQQSSEPWDQTFAHKPWIVKHDGVVYHFYCAVGDQGRVIGLATSKELKAKTKPNPNL